MNAFTVRSVLFFGFLLALAPLAGAQPKKITCERYGIEFSIPGDYRIETEEWLAARNDGAEFSDLIDHYWYSFAGSGYATVSELDRYADAKYVLSAIYARRAVVAGDFVYLPTLYRDGGYNCAVIAASEPRYVESEDGSFRGLRYFAEIAQDDYPCVTCVIVMTDGKAVFEYASKRFVSAKYASKIDKNRMVIGFDQGEFSAYLRHIDQNIDEEAVKRYAADFSGIVKSVKTRAK